MSSLLSFGLEDAADTCRWSCLSLGVLDWNKSSAGKGRPLPRSSDSSLFIFIFAISSAWRTFHKWVSQIGSLHLWVRINSWASCTVPRNVKLLPTLWNNDRSSIDRLKHFFKYHLLQGFNTKKKALSLPGQLYPNINGLWGHYIFAPFILISATYCGWVIELQSTKQSTTQWFFLLSFSCVLRPRAKRNHNFALLLRKFSCF